MTVVFGGAYQGKTAYVKKTYGLADDDFFRCAADDTRLVTDKKAVNGLHLWVLAMLRAGLDPVAALQDKLPALRGAVVLCDDISCGVVPLEAEERAWREATGRCLLLLTGEAQRVVRLFCGLESVLK